MSGEAALPELVELRVPDGEETADILQALEAGGYDVELLRQHHDTIRNAEVREYKVIA